MFSLISNFIGIYNTDKNFKVIDMKAFTKEDFITFYVDFEENDPKFKSSSLNIQLLRKEDWLSQVIWGKMALVLELSSIKIVWSQIKT